MERLKKKENELGFKILLINLKGNLKKTREIIKEEGVTIPILLDCELYSRNILHTNYTPTTFIVDTDGIIRSRLVGGCDNFEEIVEEVIKKIQ